VATNEKREEEENSSSSSDDEEKEMKDENCHCYVAYIVWVDPDKMRRSDIEKKIF
jgi:hypothetical protein